MNYDLSHIPGDLGDARLNNYFLEHSYQYFTGQIKNYWNAPMMYPDKNTLTYSDNHLGTVALYIIFRILNFDRETSFQLWIIVIFILNYFSTAFCFIKLKFNPILSAIGAYLFVFSFILVSRIFHAQLMSVFYIPWIFYFAILFFRTDQLRYLIFSIFFLELQFYCGFYMGLLSLVPLLFICLILGIRQLKLKYHVWLNQMLDLKILLSVFLIIAFILPLFIPYYLRAKETGYRSYQEVIPLLLSFRNFIMPPYDTLIWKKLEFFNVGVELNWEKELWVGAFLFILFFYYLFLRLNGRIKGFGLLSTFFFAILLSVLLFINWGNGFSFFELFRNVPGFSALKPVGRILIPLSFLSIWLSLVLVRHFFIKYRFKYYYYWLLLPVVILDHSLRDSFFIRASFSKVESQKEINELTYKVDSARARSKYIYHAMAYLTNVKSSASSIQIMAALAGQQRNLPTVNGYSSSCRLQFGQFWNNPDSTSLAKWLEFNMVDPKTVLIIH
ncbi:MAG: hypothetical protein IT267_10725 [Saprospiraceae bacterium]|nr:hypothetical protein [Saprospiraceae bacterium]